MIAADLSQMSDPHFTNVYNPYTNNVASIFPTNVFWQWVPSYDLIQSNLNSNGVMAPFRTNQLEDIFVTVQTNATCLGIGYSVSNWFTNGSGGNFPGIGTLYRYVTNTTAPLTNGNILFPSFQTAVQFGTFTNCHRIADGVVHLKIYTFDVWGNENTNELNYPSYANGAVQSLQYPVVVGNPTNSSLYITNYLPHSVDIELGILEPEAFEHARALFSAGATTAAEQYLANAAGQVEIFRQHIIITAAP
jgi:hypothetical protein